MPCAPCQQARKRLMQSAKRADVRGAARAVSVGAQIIKDKLAGMSQEDVLRKYGQQLGLSEADIAEIARKKNRRR